MQTFEYIIRRTTRENAQTVVAQGTVQASRAAVAAGRAAETLKDRLGKDDWHHRSLSRSRT